MFVRKRENVGYQRFLLFPQCFQKALSSQGQSKLAFSGKGLLTDWLYVV